MNSELSTALEHFCIMVPTTKTTGTYSRQTLDDRRLCKVAYLSYIHKDDVTINNFEEAISKHHDNAVIEFVESCFDIFQNMKNMISTIDGAGYLVK